MSSGMTTTSISRSSSKSTQENRLRNIAKTLISTSFASPEPLRGMGASCNFAFVKTNAKDSVMKRHNNVPVKVTKHITASSSHDCIACWKCVDVCPGHVFGKVNFLWHRHAKVVAPDGCIGCGKCVKVCPQSIFSIAKPL